MNHLQGLEDELQELELQQAARRTPKKPHPPKPEPVLQEMQTQWGENADAEPMLAKLKIETSVKPKTRGTTSETQDSAPSGTIANTTLTNNTNVAVQTPNIMHVKRDSLAIFAKMFPARGNIKGSASWHQFQAAMADAGFIVTKINSSEYTFRKDDVESGRSGSIIFHCPHPSPEIDPLILRCHDRGKNLRFGWTFDGFAVKKNSG